VLLHGCIKSDTKMTILLAYQTLKGSTGKPKPRKVCVLLRACLKFLVVCFTESVTNFNSIFTFTEMWPNFFVVCAACQTVASTMIIKYGTLSNAVMNLITARLGTNYICVHKINMLNLLANHTKETDILFRAAH